MLSRGKLMVQLLKEKNKEAAEGGNIIKSTKSQGIKEAQNEPTDLLNCDDVQFRVESSAIIQSQQITENTLSLQQENLDVASPICSLELLQKDDNHLTTSRTDPLHQVFGIQNILGENMLYSLAPLLQDDKECSNVTKIISDSVHKGSYFHQLDDTEVESSLEDNSDSSMLANQVVANINRLNQTMKKTNKTKSKLHIVMMTQFANSQRSRQSPIQI